MIKGLAFLGLCLSMFALSACTQQNAAATPDPKSVLQAIPDANRSQYASVRDMRNWRNPYLIVRADGVGLLDPADNAEIILKPNELMGRLAAMPASAWPYGRVVAVAEDSAKRSEQDRVTIRRNKGIVGGLLDGAHVAVQWVPVSGRE